MYQDIESEEDGQALDYALTQVLKGTSEWFVLLTIDRGYDVIPKNTNKDRISTDNSIALKEIRLQNRNVLEILRDWCAENGCAFLIPEASDSDTIMQYSG